MGQRFCLDDGEPLSLPDPYHLVGRTLADRYRIDALVGIGGMGVVYSAWHFAIDRRVAVKILQPNLAIADERTQALFEREAKLAGRLIHENIADVFDAGRTSDGIAYIAMEWLNGGTLEEELAGARTVSLRRAADLLQQIAAALDAAHAAHVVHRDLKPANVMLVRRADGREWVKVVDFGIAKAISDITHTARSIITGTPAYASPEQLSAGGEIDARSDIYSLGVILYRLLTGALPFDAASFDELIQLKLRASPTPISQLRDHVPDAVEDLIRRMLARNPGERPNRASDASALFTQAVRSAPSVASVEISSPPARDDQADTGPWRFPTPMRLPEAPPAAGPTRAETEWAERNPLLSELDFSPAVQRWAQRHSGGGTLALGAGLGALTAIGLSHVVGSACIHVALRGSSGAQHTLVFGYVAEPNAAFWYLVGVPIFMIVAAHFLNLAHSTLRELSEGERLIVNQARDEAASPLNLIAERNRRWFRIVAPAILVLSTLSVYVPEYAAGPGPAFGWVGALEVRNYEGASIRDLQAQQKVGLIPTMAQLCANGPASCDAKVTRVIGGHGATDRDRWFYPFLAFVIVALGLQVLFGAFAGWIAAKILFLFGVFTQALVNRSRPGLKIALDFEDREMRFGLGALDVVHNIVLFLIFIASGMLLLQRLTNDAKGTSFFTGMAGLQLVPQLGMLVISLLPMMLLLIAPMAVFMILIETEVGRAIEAIERERALLRKSLGGFTPPHQRATLERAEEQLRRRRDLARHQRPWPRKNSTYRLLLAATLIMLTILPFTVEYLTVSGALPTISRAMEQFSEILCWLL